MSNKKTNQFFHSRKRLFKRFHIDPLETYNIISGIQNNKYECVYKQSNKVTAFLVNDYNKKFVAFYDKRTKQVRTFMSIDMFNSRFNDEKNKIKG